MSVTEEHHRRWNRNGQRYYPQPMAIMRRHHYQPVIVSTQATFDRVYLAFAVGIGFFAIISCYGGTFLCDTYGVAFMTDGEIPLLSVFLIVVLLASVIIGEGVYAALA